MSFIFESQNKIIEDFDLFDDWMDKYSYIIDIGKEAEPFPEKYRVEENLIKGCQSKVWLKEEHKDNNKFVFYADSDSSLVKGIVTMLVKIYSNSTSKEIIDTELFFIDKIGLKEHLSINRSNGLQSMIKHIKQIAIKQISKN